MEKVCQYCLRHWGEVPGGAGVTHCTCDTCAGVPEEVLDEVAVLQRLARERSGQRPAPLLAPLFTIAGDDVRLTPANVSLLLAMGVQPSESELLYLGIAAAERAVVEGRRAV